MCFQQMHTIYYIKYLQCFPTCFGPKDHHQGNVHNEQRDTQDCVFGSTISLMAQNCCEENNDLNISHTHTHTSISNIRVKVATQLIVELRLSYQPRLKISTLHGRISLLCFASELPNVALCCTQFITLSITSSFLATFLLNEK